MNKVLQVLKEKSDKLKESRNQKQLLEFEAFLKSFFGSDYLDIVESKFEFRDGRFHAKVKEMDFYVAKYGSCADIYQEIDGELIVVDRKYGIEDFYEMLKKASEKVLY